MLWHGDVIVALQRSMGANRGVVGEIAAALGQKCIDVWNYSPWCYILYQKLSSQKCRNKKKRGGKKVEKRGIVLKRVQRAAGLATQTAAMKSTKLLNNSQRLRLLCLLCQSKTNVQKFSWMQGDCSGTPFTGKHSLQFTIIQPIYRKQSDTILMDNLKNALTRRS